jgi:hypothetical protein
VSGQLRLAVQPERYGKAMSIGEVAVNHADIVMDAEPAKAVVKLLRMARSADYSLDFIAFVEKQSGQICNVLFRHPECLFSHLSSPRISDAQECTSDLTWSTTALVGTQIKRTC